MINTIVKHEGFPLITKRVKNLIPYEVLRVLGKPENYREAVRCYLSNTTTLENLSYLLRMIYSPTNFVNIFRQL